jgi:hypothetical protein
MLLGAEDDVFDESAEQVVRLRREFLGRCCVQVAYNILE